MTEEAKEAFDALGLDHRLVKALLKSGFIKPTTVQIKSIPIALQKKDMMMRAKTGSGKTLAYSLPLLENIIRSKSSTTTNSNKDEDILTGPKAIILAPTQELIHQIGNVINSLIVFCNDIIKSLSLTQQGRYSISNEKPRLMENPDIIICTPARLVEHLKEGHVSLMNVEHIIIDEADLIITHDFEQDIKHIVVNLPSNKNRAQIIMCSATLNPNTTKLQEFFLMHHPTIIDIDGMNGNGFDENKLTEYYFEAKDFNDKFLVIFALFKLNIINGKCIVFVHNIDLSYRLKLFLEKFLIPTAVLNPKLPYNSRQSVIDKFNRGLFKYLITTDAINEHDDKTNIKNYWKVDKNKNNQDENKKEEEDDDEEDDAEMRDNDDNEYEFEKDEDDEDDDDDNDGDNDMNDDDDESEKKKPKTKRKIDEIGLAESNGLIAYRGVDFREVAAVINFSAPYTLKKYIHRAGRTARAGNYGVAITLVTPREMKKFQQVLFERVNNENNALIQKLPLNVHDLDSFRYRCESVRCSITTHLVKSARLNELRMEILNSKRLKSHFKERKREYELLRHDKMLQPAEMVKPHMSHIPSYMLANTDLANKPKTNNKRGKYNNSIKDYKETFGQLPPLMKEQMRKKRLRKAMKYNPALKKQVLIRRRFNLRHPKKQFNMNLTKNWGFLDKSTLIEKHEKMKIVRDARVYIKPVKGWKNPLKKPLVRMGRRKPSLRGLAKSQIKKIRKRTKMKKLAKRRK